MTDGGQPEPRPPPENIEPPTLSGGTVVGNAAAVQPGQWLHVTAPNGYEYEWLRDGVAFGATGPARVLNVDDVGHMLSVDVTGIGEGGRTTVRTAAVGPITEPPPPEPPDDTETRSKR